jgi:hypothetical protein
MRVIRSRRAMRSGAPSSIGVRRAVLDYTVPTIPQWRLRGLPLYIGDSDVERLITVTVASITANAALGRFPWSSAVALQDLQGMKLCYLAAASSAREVGSPLMRLSPIASGRAWGRGQKPARVVLAAAGSLPSHNGVDQNLGNAWIAILEEPAGGFLSRVTPVLPRSEFVGDVTRRRMITCRLYD